MIHIFFVSGMFGSTIEFVLRSFTSEYTPVDAYVGIDGSMHSFRKECHPRAMNDVLSAKLSENSITTPIYPFKTHHLPEILKSYPLDKSNILIYADSLRSAELNLVFQYHKIAVGKFIQVGFKLFCGENAHNIINWNKDYTHWSQMKPWELREWFSLFYVSWVQEWIDSADQVPTTFLKIKNTNILFDTKNTFLKIIKFCNLTLSTDLDLFVKEWTDKQLYIVNEFNLLDSIVEHVVNNQEFNWSLISIISESILQQRLRSKGFEIKCDGLNTFPTNSKILYSLLEKC